MSVQVAPFLRLVGFALDLDSLGFLFPKTREVDEDEDEGDEEGEEENEEEGEERCCGSGSAANTEYMIRFGLVLFHFNLE